MVRKQKPDLPYRNDWTSAANRASVSLVDLASFASPWIPPHWPFRHCGASVVTARVPSQPKDLKMSHRNIPSKTKVARAKHAKKPAKGASGSTRGGTKQETV